MKITTVLAGVAAAEPLTIKLESRAKSASVNSTTGGMLQISNGMARSLNLLFDTGSTDLVIPKKGCSTCGDHATFDPSKSFAFSKNPGYNFLASYDTAGDAQPYADPLAMQGKIVTDTITIGGVSSENQTFFLGDEFPEELGEDPMGPNIDGIFGLGPPEMSVFNALNKTFTTTFWNLVKSEKFEPVFSLFLNSGKDSRSGEVTLGGIDSSKYEGQLTRVPFNQSASILGGSWYINSPAYYIDGKSVKSSTNQTSKEAVSQLDSGTAYIMAPDRQTAKDMYAAISPEIKLLDKLGVWGAPCDVIETLQPELTFTIGDGDKLVNLTMPKDAFDLGEHPSHPGQCQTVILHAPKPITDLAAVWILGSPVLKGYYTVWDGKNLEFGVGKLRLETSTDESTSRPASGAADLAPYWGLIAVAFALI
ncbi:hypothetical protein NW762_011204 [Fusarium torreyae]|uniref:Peptidase A1 domain-containing protein n=1 Tax=Fusarium torreyae TaxID=1237075 RepID=A0A9W8RTP4_9HYPO|nr:hypothetical protein NW762_011204 [Fusarium torreyae]